jgi:hypothetical protein
MNYTTELIQMAPQIEEVTVPRPGKVAAFQNPKTDAPTPPDASGSDL